MNSGFTARAAAAIVQNHRPYFSADLLRNGAIIVPNIPLDEENGFQVNVDCTASIRRTISSGNLPNPLDYMPLNSQSNLSPFNTEIRLWAGLKYSDGTFDRWPVFTGGIEDPVVNDTDDDLTLAVLGSDRGASISRRLLPTPYVIAAGTSVTAAIQALILSVRPGITFSIAGPLDTTSLPLTVLDQMSDPWKGAQDLAAAYGMECFFNSMGVCVIRPVPDPTVQTPVWYFSEGPKAIIKAVQATLTGKQSASHAIAIGASVAGATPVRADAYDTDPKSPTLWTGAFGDVPVQIQSDLMTSQSQVNVAAAALLLQNRGAVLNVNFTHVPLTALDEEDVVYIGRQRLGLATNFVLQSFVVPLQPNAGNTMNPTCRSLRS